MRELILNAHGLMLTDAYTAGGEVLLGTARWRSSNRRRWKPTGWMHKPSASARRLRLPSQEIDGRIATLQRELQLKQVELAQNSEIQRVRVQQTASKQRGLTQLRRGHSDAGRAAKPRAAAPKAKTRKGSLV